MTLCVTCARSASATWERPARMRAPLRIAPEDSIATKVTIANRDYTMTLDGQDPLIVGDQGHDGAVVLDPFDVDAGTADDHVGVDR